MQAHVYIMTPLSVSFLPWPTLQLYNNIGYLYALIVYFFLKTVCIHILYIYTLKKKNLILLALMVEGEKKSSSFIKKKKHYTGRN